MPEETPAEAYRRFHGRSSTSAQKSPRRVHSLLRAAIYSGQLKADERILESEVVKEHATSRNAVREALVLLAEEGLVRRVAGVGTVVVGKIVELSVEGFTAPSDTVSGGSSYLNLDSATIPSTKLLRDKLRTDDSAVLMHEFVIRHGGEPFCLYTAYTRIGAPAMSFASFGAGWTLADAFQQAYGVPLAHVETHLSAVLCEPRTARKLGVQAGAPTLLRARLVSDDSGAWREYSYSYFVEPNLVMHSSSSLINGAWSHPGSPNGRADQTDFGL